MEPPTLLPPTSASASASASGFQSASSLLKDPSHMNSLSSNRNASGGLPAIPKPPPPAFSSADESASISTSGKPSPSSGSIGTALGSGPISSSGGISSKPINRPAASKNAIVYNSVQRRNPVLQSIKNVGIEVGDIVADYQVGAHNGVLFLSLKYHRLHPEYIHQRIEKMKNVYNVRILLVLCDVTEHQQSIREISKIAVINDLTVFVAWSNEEAAQYLTTMKAYEHKSADSLKEKVHQTYSNQLEHVLTSGKKVNKSDTEALAASFGSFANISRQSNHALGNVKGLGPVKVVSLLDAFNKPFLVGGIRRSKATGAATSATQSEPGPGRSSASISAPLSTLSGSISNAGGDRVSQEGRSETKRTSSETEVEARDCGQDQGQGVAENDLLQNKSFSSRERAPSWSPEPRNGADMANSGGDTIWRDPLDDEEDEEEDSGGGDDLERRTGSHSVKRARLQ